MISTKTPQHQRSIDLDLEAHESCKSCRQLIADAEREMGAFVAAVRKIAGPVAAASAAEHWVKLAEDFIPRSANGLPNWRQLTITASTRLAAADASSVNETIARRTHQS